MEILLVFEPGPLIAKLLASYSNVSHYCVQNPPYHCRIWKRKTTGQPYLLYRVFLLLLFSPQKLNSLQNIRILWEYYLPINYFLPPSGEQVVRIKLFLLISNFEDNLDSFSVKIRKYGLNIECEIKYIKNPTLYICNNLTFPVYCGSVPLDLFSCLVPCYVAS